MPPEVCGDTAGMRDYKEIIFFSFPELQQIKYTGLSSLFARVPLCALKYYSSDNNEGKQILCSHFGMVFFF